MACSGGVTEIVENLPRPTARPELPVTSKPSQEELQNARAKRNRALNKTAETASADAIDEALRDRYARIQRALLANGRLRLDRVPQDAPISAETLVRDFIQVALRDEYSPTDQVAAKGNSAPLRRWQQPVRMQVEFGVSTDTGQRNRIRGQIADYASRLKKATGGHPVSLTAAGGNFVVMLLDEAERRNLDAYLARLVPDIPVHDIIALRGLSPDIYCTVFAYSQGKSASYAKAVAVIRAELPSLLQLSCIHEELAQGMGLANDSPASRPSIFNDDEEFALLTRHDELLLKILYDPRLRPGMTESEAAPIIRQIAQELLPGSS